MAPSFSRPTGTFDSAMVQQRGPPPIPFQKENNVSNPLNNSRDAFLSISLRTEPGNPESGTYDQKVRTFSDGMVEEFIRWRMAFDEVTRAKPLLNGGTQISMANVLLMGAAKDLFSNTVLCVKVDNEDDDEIFAGALDALTKRYIPLDGLARQKAYLRYQLRLSNIGIKPFVARLTELNNYLFYFPGGDRTSKHPDDKLIEIID